MKYYKFLAQDGGALYGWGHWHLPTTDGPGLWMRTVEDPAPCVRGYHAFVARDLRYWLNDISGWTEPRLFEVELAGIIIEHDNKVVASEGRLLREIDTFTPELLVSYARSCAYFASKYSRNAPNDHWGHQRNAVLARRNATYAKVALPAGELKQAMDSACRAAAYATEAAYWAAKPPEWGSSNHSALEAQKKERDRQTRWLIKHLKIKED